MKLPSFVYDYDVINDSLFLILQMNRYLAASFNRFYVLEKQKLIKTNSQTDQITWVDQRQVKSYEKRQLNLKYHLLKTCDYAEKKVLYLEAVAQRCSVRKVFLKISPNSQENTCARVCKKCCRLQASSVNKNTFFIEHFW